VRGSIQIFLRQSDTPRADVCLKKAYSILRPLRHNFETHIDRIEIELDRQFVHRRFNPKQRRRASRSRMGVESYIFVNEVLHSAQIRAAVKHRGNFRAILDVIVHHGSRLQNLVVKRQQLSIVVRTKSNMLTCKRRCPTVVNIMLRGTTTLTVA